MRDDDDCGHNLLSEPVEVFVSILNLLVQGLVLNLELLKINKMKTIGQLLSLLQDLLLVSETVTKGDVLQTVLMHLLVLHGFVLLPLVEGLLGNLLASSRHDCVGGHASLQFLKLLFNLVALSLLLVELSLKLRSHLVVSVLGLLEINPDLVHICQCIEVLVVVHVDILLLLVLLKVLIHHYDLLLELLVLLLQLLLLSDFFLDGLDQVTLHLVLGGKVLNAV